MPLSAGARLGPYSVTAKIGEGGMGEVCRARDTKLDRDVASPRERRYDTLMMILPVWVAAPNRRSASGTSLSG